MKRFFVVVMVAMAMAMVVPAVAGDDHHCKASADDCLDTMAAKIQNKAWLGVETEETAHGRWQVTSVYPGSPAEQAGFKTGDVFVAMNGVDMSKENKAAYKEAKHGLGPGSQATYVVKRQGGKVKLTAELGSVPSDVMAQWVGEHMLTEHSKVQMASK